MSEWLCVSEVPPPPGWYWFWQPFHDPKPEIMRSDGVEACGLGLETIVSAVSHPARHSVSDRMVATMLPHFYYWSTPLECPARDPVWDK